MKANKDDVPKNFLVMFSFLVCFSLVVVVHSQDIGQAGFISLDCGRLPKNASYSEPLTGVTYISDEAFIDGGESKSIAPEYKGDLQEQAAYVRAFPEGTRNCYEIGVAKGERYLIRATFVYGNYDGLKKLPEFDLYYGVTLWDAVKLNGLDTSTVKEIVHIPALDIVHVCLVNTGYGTPFISALELRPLKNTSYVTPSGSLSLVFRADVGAAINESAYRYPYDAFDRMWLPYNSKAWTKVKASGNVYIGKNYQPPPIVMSTAGTPTDEDSPMVFGWTDPSPSTVYYVYMYFAELVELKANESRGFNIMLNTELLYGPLFPAYLNQTTIFTPTGLTGGNFTFSIVRLENSTLPPIFNAIEVYTLVDFSQSETEQSDVDAITKIKSGYGVKRNWEADPCLPKDYLWTGLNCSYDGLDPPRITSLNLSSSGLTGEISSYISNLTLIESLDLSNNNLIGSVPDFLSQLPNLRVLNLERNKLKGSIPAELIKKSENGLLSLRVGENSNLTCSSLISCGSSTHEATKKNKNNVLIPILASVGGSIVFLLILAVVIFTVIKRRNGTVRSRDENDPLASKQRQFTNSEIVKITNNFQKTLGKGGFGTVYHGVIDKNTQVAVKVLTPPPAVQGDPQSQTGEQDTMQTFFHQQFQAEVTLLMRVHHANLTSLVGYCNEGDTKALIYEYMENGDLESHILDHDNANILSWERRLQIAIDSAQGLEYLHTGCKPQIAHRDVKCTNILLNERFQAKIADFGLSKVFNDENATHVSTKVAGTRGYLDPEYFSTNRLNEKSDVYSFGVVLLEIITGRHAISRNHERTHIIQWVTSMLSNGDIKSIVDPRLRGDFETNSAWKAVELAMACVSRAPGNRPTMSQVVTELKDCLAVESSRRNNSRLTASPIDDSIELLTMNMTSSFSPSVR